MPFKELKAEEWFDEIEDALDFRETYGLESSWVELEALFYNVHNSQAHEGPNIMASQGDAMISSLTVPDPYVSINPTRDGFVDHARILERVDNALIKEMNMRREVERSTLHSFLWGRAILKVGYDSEFGYDPKQDVMGGQAGATVSQFDKKGRAIEFGIGPARPGMPWVRAVPNHDFVVPWGTIELDDAPWCAHRVVRHIDDIKADPKYSNKRNLSPVMSMEDFTKSYTTRMKAYRVGHAMSDSVSRGAEYCELWEIHDRRTQKVIVVATGYDKIIRDEIDLLQLNGLPFVSVSFRPNARTFWTTPDAYYLRQAQLELSDISLQNQKQRRIAVAKVLAEKGVLTEAEAMKLLSADVGVLVEVEGGRSVRDQLTTFNITPNPLSYQEAELTRRNAREAVGFSRNQLGEFEQSGRRTATEANIVEQKSERRLDRRQLRIRDLYLGAVKTINSIIFEFWKAPQKAQVVGSDGFEQWVQYTGQELKGKYDYELGFSNEPVTTASDRRQQALGVYQSMVADPQVDPVALRRYLAAAFNDAEFGRIFRPGSPSLGASEGANLRLPMQGVSGGQGNVPPQNRPASA